MDTFYVGNSFAVCSKGYYKSHKMFNLMLNETSRTFLRGIAPQSLKISHIILSIRFLSRLECKKDLRKEGEKEKEMNE